MTEKETHNFPVKNFDRIAFHALGKVKIIQGDEEGLTISGDPQALEHVKIDVEGGELVIKLFTWYDFLFVPRPANYVIKVKNLHAIQISGSAEIESDELLASVMNLGISGAGKISINSLESADVRMSVSGSARIDVASLVGNQVEIHSSGSAKFKVGGNAESLELRTSGSAEVNAFDLAAHNVRINVSGTGTYEVQAISTLHVSVSGSANVGYHGDPKVTQSISGSASIYRAE
jgi:hypothetical protein